MAPVSRQSRAGLRRDRASQPREPLCELLPAGQSRLQRNEKLTHVGRAALVVTEERCFVGPARTREPGSKNINHQRKTVTLGPAERSDTTTGEESLGFC